LVLDLDGDGVELTALTDQNLSFFDLDNDGFAEQTGWVGADDGLLAIDLNGDGVINDTSELFGNQTGFDNGFLALAALDSNDDGVISATDTDFANLLVWVDADGDGFSDDGELYSLTHFGITEIDLGYNVTNYQIAGNDVLQEGSFTMNGVSHTIVDAYFANNQVNTTYVADYSLDSRALFLPTVPTAKQWSEAELRAEKENVANDNNQFFGVLPRAQAAQKQAA
jgi:hypothetical protein